MTATTVKSQSDADLELAVQKRIEEEDEECLEDLISYEMYEAMCNMHQLRVEGVLV
jgi:hypothetical protein